MGSVCCVAVKDRNLPSGPGSGATHNTVCSPPWSFRRDNNRRRVVDEIKDSFCHNSYVGNRGIIMDKLSLDLKRVPPSQSGGLTTTPASQKSAISEMGTTSIITAPLMGTSPMIQSPSDVSLASPVCVEVKNIVDSPDIVASALPKPSCSTSVSDLPSAHTYSLPSRSTPSRRARGSPAQHLFRQVSDCQTLGLKSPNNNSTSEVLSTCSNDTATGSHNASSEGGWSMNAFCELVAQSQRERWSFDSEHLGSERRRLSGCSSSRFSCSPSVDQQTCGNCSKLLTERSSTVGIVGIARFDLPIASVLACGHVYHAECLETMTSETEKYDPTCPICSETQVTKLSRKALKAEAELKAKSYKRCKNRVVDSYVRSECENLVFQKLGKREGKGLKMDPSSSTKGSTSKPFIKWHFGSISAKWSKPLARDSTSKKGFWSRHSNKKLSHSSSSIEGLNQTR